MKPRVVATMFIALMLSSPAYSAKYLVITKNDGTKSFFAKSTFAISKNGKTHMHRQGKMCTFFNHPKNELAKGDCKAIFDKFNRLRTEMMQKHGMSEQSMMANLPKGSSRIREIGGKDVAGYRTKCYEAGQWGEIIVCTSKKVHDLIRNTVGVDPRVWTKDFDMANMPKKDETATALDKVTKDAFEMSRVNYFTEMGLNPFLVANMSKEKCEQLLKDAKAQGEPPGDRVVSVKTELAKINLHESYAQVPLEEFFGFDRMRGMTGTGPGATEAESASGKRKTPETPNMDAMQKQMDKMKEELKKRGIKIPGVE